MNYNGGGGQSQAIPGSWAQVERPAGGLEAAGPEALPADQWTTWTSASGVFERMMKRDSEKYVEFETRGIDSISTFETYLEGFQPKGGESALIVDGRY